MKTSNLPTKTVITLVNGEIKHNESKWKTCRGKQLAVDKVYGKWSTTYEALPHFMNAMVSSNHGSVAVIDDVPRDSEMNTSFCKRVFWCLKAKMDGWKHARPVISIDGTFLKGRYNEKLLVAIGVDGNNHQYPICYTLVEEESEDNWSWFLILLRRYVCRDKLNVCIIPDRAKGILKTVNDPSNGFTPPYGIHKYCLFRVRINFCNKHPGGELKELVWLAGTIPQLRKHNVYMKRISEISLPALQYLTKINRELWTICHDIGSSRYGQATTNIMEAFNSNISMTCFLPVTAKMEYIFYKTVKIVNTNRNEAIDGMQRGEKYCRRTNAMIARYMEKAKAHNRPHGIFEAYSQVSC